MFNNGLDLLMNRKKVCKKKYNEETVSYNNFNNYKKNDNMVFENKKEKTQMDDVKLCVVMESLDNVDKYILETTDKDNLENISNYLIDLLYVIKTKKK